MVTQTTSPTPDRGNKRPKHGEGGPPQMPYYPHGPPFPGGMPPGPPPYGWPPGYGPPFQGGPPPLGMPYHPRGPMGRPPPPDYWKKHPQAPPPPHHHPDYPHPGVGYGVMPPSGYGSMRRSATPPRARSFTPAREDGKEDDGTASVATNSSQKDKARGNYKCGRCGVPKRGHICPYQPKIKRKVDEPPPETRNAAIQVEIDEFMTLRRLNIRIQGLPESYATEADPYMGESMVVGEPHPLPPADDTEHLKDESDIGAK